MQDQMKDIQTEMERSEFTGTAGNGAVSISFSGKYDPLKVNIKEEAMGDREMLEDLVLTALKDLNSQITDAMEQKMSKVTAGLNIPGLKLPGF